MNALMGIDLGTSGVKTVVMREDGRHIAAACQAYSIDVRETGYAEQDPEVWWASACLAIAETIQTGKQSGNAIAGVGLSGQMHGLVAIGTDGRALRPAIIWADQRTIEQKELLESLYTKEDFGACVQNPISTGFMLLSLLWIKQNEPSIYNKIWKVLLPKDYIRFRLTGEIGTDTTDASGTLAYDVIRKEWSKELLDALGLDRGMFPPVSEPWAISGSVTREASEVCHLPEGTCVVFGGADQPMQAIGNGIIRPGLVSCTIGTGGQLLSPAWTPRYDKLLRTHTFVHAVPDQWYTMAAVLNAGLAHRWLAEQVLRNTDYSIMNAMAESIAPGSEGLIFLPYLAGERTPHMDPYAKGILFGFTLKHRDAHIVRAVMEGVCFALREGLDIMRQLGTNVQEMVLAGGGARSLLWQQMLADIFDCEVYLSDVEEQACTGAAMMAGVGCGVYGNVIEACGQVVRRNTNPVVPNRDNISLYNEQYALYQQVYTQNKPLFRRSIVE